MKIGVSATRLTLLLVLAGLGLVVVAVLLTGGFKASIEYGAAFLFIGAWMVVKNGIVETKPESTDISAAQQAI